MSEPKLSEKDMAAIRKHVEACRAYVLKGSENAFPDGPEDTLAILADAEKLLADRDAHLADLKEARELIVESKSFSYCSGMAPSRRCDHCKRVDALLERTK